MMDIAHNPAFEVRAKVDAQVQGDELGWPATVPAGTLGVIDPFSVYAGDPYVSVIFAAPYRPRYGRGSIRVLGADLEWVNPEQAVGAYRLPAGTPWTQPILTPVS